MKVDNKGYKVNPDHQLEDLGLHHGLPMEKKMEVSVEDNVLTLPKISVQGNFFKQSASQRRKQKGCPHLYEGDPEEVDEEEVITAMCHSNETYSSIQANRKDNEYYQQLCQ